MVLLPAAVLRALGPAISHGALEGVETVKSRLVLLVLATVNAGIDEDPVAAEPFTGTLKLRAVALGTTIEFGLTYIVTGIVTGLFGRATPVVAFVPVIVTVPVQVRPTDGMVLGGVTLIGNEALSLMTAAVTPDVSH